METDIVREFDKKISDETIINIPRKKTYDEIIDELEEENENLASNMPWNTTEQATEISVTDAAKYSKNKLELFGNTHQDDDKMTYRCNGSEDGDYYFTYDNVNYKFTMPEIQENETLVFDINTHILMLNDTEITIEEVDDVTQLTQIIMAQIPNKDYGDEIHVLTGRNIIEVKSKNIFNKDDYKIVSLNAARGDVGYGTYAAANNQKHVYVECKPNTKYTIARKIRYSTVQGVYETEDVPHVGGTYYLHQFTSNSNGYSYATTSASAKYIVVRINTEALTTQQIKEILDSLMIIEGEHINQAEYIPFYYKKYELELNNIKMCDNGHEQDRFIKEKGVWYKREIIREHLFTSHNISWHASGSNYYYQLPVSAARRKAYMNRYKYNSRTAGFNYLGDMEFGFENNSNGTLHVKNTEVSNDIELNSWMKNKGISLYYERISPILVEITDNTLISQLEAIYNSFELVRGTNRITITPLDLAPNVQLTYMQDLPSKLDKLEAMVIENS